MKRFFSVVILVLLISQLKAQVAISYFPFQSILSISTNTDKRFFGDFKLETNHYFSNLNMEFSPKYNFKIKEKVRYFIGVGVSINPSNGFSNLPITNGYFLDFGMRASPFEGYRNFQVVFELSPYVNREFNGGNLRSRIGIGWSFGNGK